MATAKQTYDANIIKIEKKISEVVEANRSDLARIPELKESYKRAIDDFEIEKADGINAEIDRLERTAALRKEQIDALKAPEHPMRVKARELYAEGLDAEKEAIKAECAPLVDEIKAAREKYLELAAKIFPVEERFYENAREKHRLVSPKEAMTLVPHGLPGNYHDALVREHDLQAKDREVRAQHFAQIAERYKI